MRARHRHFNPKDAGAVAAYDARFITALNDGTNVATWASRTGTNDATQSTDANRPKYETNEINGNPVVDFTGGKGMIISISIPNNLTVIKVFRRIASGGSNVFFASSGGQYDSWWFSDNVTYTRTSAGFNTHGAADTRSGSFVESWTKSGTSSSQVWRSGAMVGTSQTPQTSSGTYDRIGVGVSGATSQAVGCGFLFDSAVSNSIRKRCEHASAYSFKITCS